MKTEKMESLERVVGVTSR